MAKKAWREDGGGCFVSGKQSHPCDASYSIYRGRGQKRVRCVKVFKMTSEAYWRWKDGWDGRSLNRKFPRGKGVKALKVTCERIY